MPNSGAAQLFMSHTFAVKIRLFKLASHKMNTTYWTGNSDKIYLSLFTADHLIARQKTETRMLMKQNGNTEVRKDQPIYCTYAQFQIN